MSKLYDLGSWVYSYSTDFCLNMSHLLGIDYVTFGSIFFGLIMNGVIIFLLLLNVRIELKRKRRRTAYQIK